MLLRGRQKYLSHHRIHMCVWCQRVVKGILFDEILVPQSVVCQVVSREVAYTLNVVCRELSPLDCSLQLQFPSHAF